MGQFCRCISAEVTIYYCSYKCITVNRMVLMPVGMVFHMYSMIGKCMPVTRFLHHNYRDSFIFTPLLLGQNSKCITANRVFFLNMNHCYWDGIGVLMLLEQLSQCIITTVHFTINNTKVFQMHY